MIDQAHKELNIGNYIKASHLYELFYKQNPLSFDCLANWSQAVNKLGQHDRAFMLSLMALTLGPKHGEMFKFARNFAEKKINQSLLVVNENELPEEPIQLYRLGYAQRAYIKARELIISKPGDKDKNAGVYLWLCAETNNFKPVIRQQGELQRGNYSWGFLARCSMAWRQGDLDYAKTILSFVAQDKEWDSEYKLMLSRLESDSYFKKNYSIENELKKNQENRNLDSMTESNKTRKITADIWRLIEILNDSPSYFDAALDLGQKWVDIGEILFGAQFLNALANKIPDYQRGWVLSIEAAILLPAEPRDTLLSEILKKIPASIMRMAPLQEPLVRAGSYLNRIELVEKATLYGIILCKNKKFFWEFLSIYCVQEKMIDRSISLLSTALISNENNKEKSDLYGRISVVSQLLDDGPLSELMSKRGIELDPNNQVNLMAISQNYRDQREMKNALDYAERFFEISPNNPLSSCQLAICLAYQGRWPRVKQLFDHSLSVSPPGTRSKIWENRLFVFSYHPDLDAKEIANEFFKWGEEIERNTVAIKNKLVHTKRDGIRVGFLSPDIRAHTSRYYFWPLFSNTPNGITTIALSDARLEEEVSGEFKKLFNEWHTVSQLNDEELVNLIKKLDLDCIIDGCNHMANTRVHLYARRLAPVQMTWLGSAWTSGLKEMDYVIMDPICAPEGSDHLFSEKVIRLPYSLFCYNRYELPDISTAPCLKNGYITFGNFGRVERFNRHTFRVWKEIMQNIPNSKFIFDFKTFKNKETSQYFMQLLKDHGLPVERIELRHSNQVLPAFSDIDLTLDAFPHAGGTVLFDSLSMGVPVITLASRPPVGRFGANMMTNIDLTEFIAVSESDYVRKAIKFSSNFQEIQNLRLELRNRLVNSPLWDGASFAKYFFAAVFESVNISKSGKSPVAFDVSVDGKVNKKNWI